MSVRERKNFLYFYVISLPNLYPFTDILTTLITLPLTLYFPSLCLMWSALPSFYDREITIIVIASILSEGRVTYCTLKP
jgi:hypothetical protein